MAIVLLKLAAFTALCYYFSKACFNNCGLNKDNYFSQDFILNTVTGICSHLLLTHLLSYITQNVTTSIYLSLSILVSTSVVLTIKNKIAWTKIFNQVDLFDLGCIGISGLLASFYKIRYELFGDSARFHLALVGSISNNNIYPPVYPSNHDLPMPFYHYGLDFSLTNLKTITGLSTIEIFPIHTGFTCFLGLVAVFVFFRYFIKSPIYSFLATFFYLTISHTSIEFLTREIFNITSPDFIKSWKSTLGLYGASGLGDGRGGLYFMLSFTFLLIIISVVSGLQTSSRMKLINLIPITAISFMLFMFKNALWSMTFAATLISLTLILINKVFINKEKTFRFIINSAILVISVYLGKILSFSNPLSMGFNGIDPVTWAPSLKWVMHSFGYLSYFYDNEYMNNVATVTDLSQAAQRPLNLFFSTLSMRKFGYVFIPAILLFIYQVSQKQINKSSLIFFITC
ncbi:MAG: hypothetical protein O3C63_09010, partial [Cyanobacteria bacterium]|nr:hypothetical protein [Cyanobacteriota bacterium]